MRGLGGEAEDLLFSGQASLPALAAGGSVALLVMLTVAKMLGYAVSLGCGFRGGAVFPAIFIGIAVAMIPAVLFQQSPTIAVAVGAAAGMAASTRMLFSPVLFAALLIGAGSQDAVPAAILGSVAGWLTAMVVHRSAESAVEDEAGVDAQQRGQRRHPLLDAAAPRRRRG